MDNREDEQVGIKIKVKKEQIFSNFEVRSLKSLWKLSIIKVKTVNVKLHNNEKKRKLSTLRDKNYI